MKKVVVSFADETGNYRKQMGRLEKSIRHVGFDGIFRGYTSFGQIGSPHHKGPGSVPYAFKAMAIKKAIWEESPGIVLWIDSPIIATASIDPIFEYIEEHGYVFFDNVGHSLGTWTSDACLERFGISREKSFDMKMIMACVMGFRVDKYSPIIDFLDAYIDAAMDGVSYMGDWFNQSGQVSVDNRVRGHRHDQSVASCLIANMGLDVICGQDSFFAYREHVGQMPISSSVCLWSQAM